MIYRITFGFSGANTGWAETHAMLSNLNNPNQLMPTLIDVAQKRAQMLGREFAIIAIRASRYATDAGARAKGSFVLKQRFVNSIQTNTAAAEPAAVAYIVRGSAEPSILNPQFDANQNQSFLGGPLDVCVDNAGIVDQGKGGLGAAFASWRSVVLGTTIGWLANQTIMNVPISLIASNINGTVTFTIAQDPPATLVVGQYYKCRVRAVNGGVSPLNRELICQCATVTTLVTKEVIGLALSQLGGFVRVYKQIQPFVDYGDLTLNSEVGKHKRGRPFGSTPGRARKRILG